MSEEVGCGGRLVAVAEIAPDLLTLSKLDTPKFMVSLELQFWVTLEHVSC
jgi:hypothetical protein